MFVKSFNMIICFFAFEPIKSIIQLGNIFIEVNVASLMVVPLLKAILPSRSLIPDVVNPSHNFVSLVTSLL